MAGQGLKAFKRTKFKWCIFSHVTHPPSPLPTASHREGGENFSFVVFLSAKALKNTTLFYFPHMVSFWKCLAGDRKGFQGPPEIWKSK